MREILFRGKSRDTDKWVFGDFVSDVCRISHDEYLNEYGDVGYIGTYVIPETFGQFTGLTDKNGKKIFEGDVVNGLLLYSTSIKSVVTFKDGAFGLEWDRGSVKVFSAFTSICNVEYEIIGNIHDNPELLKGGAE